MSHWTDQADALLVELWRAGHDMQRIADMLTAAGHGEFTRNMIAGRKHRLRIKGVDLKVRSEPMPFVMAKRRAALSAIAPKADAPVEHDRGVEYMKLGPDGCKAILDWRGSDGLSMCCGKKRLDAEPYCAAHTRAFTAPLYVKRSNPGKEITNGESSEAR
jgi:hypothetical protein